MICIEPVSALLHSCWQPASENLIVHKLFRLQRKSRNATGVPGSASVRMGALGPVEIREIIDNIRHHSNQYRTLRTVIAIAYLLLWLDVSRNVRLA